MNDIIIPPFANEQNRQLAAEISRKKAELDRLIAATTEQDERRKAMEEHQLAITTDIQQTELLLEAKRNQLQSEHRLMDLSSREHGQIEREIKARDLETAEIRNQIATLESTIATGEGEIQKLRQKLKMTASEYATWSKNHRDKESDHLALEKYSKDDARRLTDLNVKVQRLTSDLAKRKQLLRQKMTEADLKRLDVETTTATLKSLHHDREDLIGKWEKSLQMVDKKQADIEKATEERLALESELTSTKILVRQRNEDFERIERQIADTEKQIETLERTLASQINILDNEQVQVAELKISADVLRTTLKSVNNSVANQKKANIDLEQELATKKELLAAERVKRSEAEKNLAGHQNETLGAQKKNEQLDEEIEKELAKKKKLELKLKEKREERLKLDSSLATLKQEEKQFNIFIESSRASLKSLKAKNAKMEEKAVMEETLAYNVAFEVQQMERKIRRINGERSKEETEDLKAKISELEAKLEDWRRKHTALTTENRQSTHDLRKATRILQSLTDEKEVIQGQLAELEVQISAAKNQLAAKTREKEEAIVEESLAKLEYKKLRSQYENRHDDKLSVEAKQLQLNFFVEERMREIEAYKDILKMRAKLAEEGRSKVSISMREAITKVEKIKRKYEIVMMNLNSTRDDQDEDGEERGQAYYIIKAAEKKEVLRRDLEEIEVKIKHAESEVAALQLTLNQIIEQNDDVRLQYKQQFIDLEVQEKKVKLEQQAKDLMTEFKNKNKILAEVNAEVENLTGEIAVEHSRNDEKSAILSSMQTSIDKLSAELQAQKEKEERATMQVEKLQKTCRTKYAADTIKPAEEDIAVKELKDENRHIFLALKAEAALSPSAQEAFEAFCTKNSISTPSRAGSVASTAASSTVGSRSASRMASASAKKKLVAAKLEIGLEQALNIGVPLKADSGWKPSSKLVKSAIPKSNK